MPAKEAPATLFSLPSRMRLASGLGLARDALAAYSSRSCSKRFMPENGGSQDSRRSVQSS